jgi:hypothetical protein
MTSCSAAQATCQEQCRASIPWYKFQQRQECQAECNVGYAECYASLVTDAEQEASNQFANQSNTIKTIIIITMAVIAVIFLIYIWKKRNG